VPPTLLLDALARTRMLKVKDWVTVLG
jgi:hypothetical protein